MEKKRYSEKGLTLVEILAALAILGIVLITFMTFFTQSAKFTAHNKEKLTEVQVAEAVIGKIRSVSSVDEIDTIDGFDEAGSSDSFQDTTTYPAYKVDINIEEGPTDRDLKLATVHVLSTSGAELSNQPYTTHMYLEVEE